MNFGTLFEVFLCIKDVFKYFFIRCFYQYFAMLVAEAHEGLSLAGHFTDRQSASVQGFDRFLLHIHVLLRDSLSGRFIFLRLKLRN